MKKRSRPHSTLSDVAERAGVGRTTVSRVINGAHKVSPETLKRVNKAIRVQSLRLKIPDDVALIGFDDFELTGTLRPAVTVVKQPVGALGSRAAKVLFEQMQPVTASRRDEAKLTRLETSLIVRASCGCPSA